VVVTTYNTLGTEWGGKRGRYSDVGSPLAHIKWVSSVAAGGHGTCCLLCWPDPVIEGPILMVFRGICWRSCVQASSASKGTMLCVP